ncbi:Ankyrin repeat domain-containing protein 33B, partial [Melipona quadrifasciata]
RLEEDNRLVNVARATRLRCNSLATKGNNCPVNNTSIVASRGELARNNYVARETPALSTIDKSAVNANGTRAKFHHHFPKQQSSNEVATSVDRDKSQRPIRKSFSVPDYLRDSFFTTRKIDRKTAEDGFLKKSSAFLSSLTHSAARIRASKLDESHSEDSYCNENTCSIRHSPLRGYLSILSRVTNDLEPFRRRSSSVQTLPVERRRRSNARVKKSVSFSSDTSFEEKRLPYRRVAAVHEVTVYHKGVLQDRSVREADTAGKVPSSWQATSEGASALLRASRDADDTALEQIAAHMRKFGLADMDVNIADSSGRTAISYMAGNGASTMLELALSYDRLDPNVPDNEGNTPLHFAAQAGQTECLNILLQRCPDIQVDARNASGFTPLMKAALQGRTKCAKILLFAGANPTLRDHGRGLRAEQWARFCGRYVCAEVIERFARHRLLERSTSCRWGSEPELAAKVLQGKVMPLPTAPLSPPSSGLKSKIRKVFRTTSGPDRNFSLVSQLTSAALCASSPALPKSSDVPPVVKSLLRPLSVPQLRVTLVSPQDFLEQSKDKYAPNFTEKIENTVGKPSRSKNKNK